MEHDAIQYTTYAAWNDNIRDNEHYCVRTLGINDDNTIVVFTIDRKMLGFWDCIASRGEIYQNS